VTLKAQREPIDDDIDIVVRPTPARREAEVVPITVW